MLRVLSGRDSLSPIVVVIFRQVNETRRIDVAALQAGGTLPKDANWASVTLTTNGLPDELMAVAASYDKTLQYGAQTPFSDGIGRVHRYPLAELKCVSPKRGQEMAARLGGEPGSVPRLESSRHGYFRPLFRPRA